MKLLKDFVKINKTVQCFYKIYLFSISIESSLLHPRQEESFFQISETDERPISK